MGEKTAGLEEAVPPLLMLCAAVHVERAREMLGVELAALVGESYERAYGDMVRVQQLTELEEVITFSNALELSGGDPFVAGTPQLGPSCGGVCKSASHCSIVIWWVNHSPDHLLMSL